MPNRDPGTPLPSPDRREWWIAIDDDGFLSVAATQDYARKEIRKHGEIAGEIVPVVPRSRLIAAQELADADSTIKAQLESQLEAVEQEKRALLGEAIRAGDELVRLQAVEQRIEWAFAALHGDPLFGAASFDPLYADIANLRARLGAVERERDALKEALGLIRSSAFHALNDLEVPDASL
jgi:hypothetical protein